MDLGKIGEFIAKLRKEKKLTQAQLGKMLGVTDRSVSKWENGVCAPNITLLNQLSDILGITTTELLNGERVTSIDGKKASEITTKSIKYYNRVAKKRLTNKFIIVIFSIIAIFVFVVATFFVKNNYDNCYMYTISSGDDDYRIEGLLIVAPEKEVLILNSVKNSSDLEYFDVRAYTYQYSLQMNDVEIFRVGNISLYEYQKGDQLIYFNDILSMINIYVVEDSNYNEIITEDRVKNNDIKLKITYLDKNKKAKDKLIELKMDKIYSNNKIFYDGGTEL